MDSRDILCLKWTSLEICIYKKCGKVTDIVFLIEHEISDNVVCATSRDFDRPAHTRSLIRVFDGRLSIL